MCACELHLIESSGTQVKVPAVPCPVRSAATLSNGSEQKADKKDSGEEDQSVEERQLQAQTLADLQTVDRLLGELKLNAVHIEH